MLKLWSSTAGVCRCVSCFLPQLFLTCGVTAAYSWPQLAIELKVTSWLRLDNTRIWCGKARGKKRQSRSCASALRHRASRVVTVATNSSAPIVGSKSAKAPGTLSTKDGGPNRQPCGAAHSILSLYKKGLSSLVLSALSNSFFPDFEKKKKLKPLSRHSRFRLSQKFLPLRRFLHIHSTSHSEAATSLGKGSLPPRCISPTGLHESSSRRPLDFHGPFCRLTYSFDTSLLTQQFLTTTVRIIVSPPLLGAASLLSAMFFCAKRGSAKHHYGVLAIGNFDSASVHFFPTFLIWQLFCKVHGDNTTHRQDNHRTFF